MVTNSINKIYVNDNIQIEDSPMSALLFCDSKIISKKMYSIIDNVLNLIDLTEGAVSLFINSGTARYYEYRMVLTSGNTIISGVDVFKNTIPTITNQSCIIFVNGEEITKDDYIISEGKITITSNLGKESGSTVIILLSSEIQYLGELKRNNLITNDNNRYCLSIYQYNSDKYIFFKNHKLINKNKITSLDEYNICFNIDLTDSDTITYYRLPTETLNYFFDTQPGYLSYGPMDDYNRKIPEIFDTKVIFSKAARLVIDDIRKGMIISEEVGTGSAMIVCDDFESPTVKCIKLGSFSKQFFLPYEYYIQVPEARSILKYISEYDLQQTLFPELLGSFQRLLLDETYDSIQRLKNIRNMNKVDSEHITSLIDFLGLKINLTNMTIEQKHAILDELTNFYRIIGTRPSYNYYNMMTQNSKIIKLDQLFTPIKNGGTVSTPIYRYITFRTAEELGAEYKREFIVDLTDYGRVDELANNTDSYRNTNSDIVRSSGILQDISHLPVSASPRLVYFVDSTGDMASEELPTPLNLYITNPTMGPNKPSPNYDYGNLEDLVLNTYDYGSVEDDLSGHWITWYEWERPKNWYPTNHVQLSAEIPPEMNYNNFMDEFKRIFYDISSAVLYIHDIIEIYTFGGNEGPGSGGGAGGGGGGGGGGGSGGSTGGKSTAGYFAINANGGPLVVTQEYCFTNDPEIQVAPDQLPDNGGIPVVENYQSTYDKKNDTVTLTEYTGSDQNVVTPSEF